MPRPENTFVRCSRMTLTTRTDDRGIATITLDRVGKANAINRELLNRLFDALQDATRDYRVRVIVIRGAGLHFCAGADVGDLENHATTVTIPELCEFLDELPKPTICVVQGACMGAGLALAACCDTVIATHDARFSIPEVRLGVAPAPLIPAMVRACGARFLRRHLLSGGRFDALEAHHAGLVHWLCKASDLEDRIALSIDDYLHAAPGAVKTAKALLQQCSGTGSFPARNELEKIFSDLSISDEAKEGIASFKEGRPPKWYCI